VGLTEPGAATSAMVALTASQRAVAHYVSSRTIGIGTGRFGICGTHLEPLADLTCPHILQESLPSSANHYITGGAVDAVGIFPGFVIVVNVKLAFVTPTRRSGCPQSRFKRPCNRWTASRRPRGANGVSLAGETACTHIEVRTARPLVSNRRPKLLLRLPPYQRPEGVPRMRPRASLCRCATHSGPRSGP
jgi:hypothetical protein